jgi:hypothetical protein
VGDRRDVSFSLVQPGDVFLARDELADALNAYRESLAIRRAIAAKLGNVLAAQGHIADARAGYEKSHDTSGRFGSPMPPGTGAGHAPAG